MIRTRKPQTENAGLWTQDHDSVLQQCFTYYEPSPEGQINREGCAASPTNIYPNEFKRVHWIDLKYIYQPWKEW